MRALPALLAGVLAITSLNAAANIVVGADDRMSLGGGVADLGCTDVIVEGVFDLGGGALRGVRNVEIRAGGQLLAGGAATISLAGNWSNRGAFDPGNGSVSFVDGPGCASASTISGGSTFFALSIVSSSGKPYQFEAGSTQRVIRTLTLQGTASAPLQIGSTVPGQQGNVHLDGVQRMSMLAVHDMRATGEWLALGLTNLYVGSNDNVYRWFGVPVVPTLERGLLFVLMLALGCTGLMLRTARRPFLKERK
ncbi:MAG: hypothetical protein JSS05_02970 [Proteobacteria bacterium]|nr:hypothetical protein [Pseudomonadota bacterium]